MRTLHYGQPYARYPYIAEWCRGWDDAAKAAGAPTEQCRLTSVVEIEPKPVGPDSFGGTSEGDCQSPPVRTCCYCHRKFLGDAELYEHGINCPPF